MSAPIDNTIVMNITQGTRTPTKKGFQTALFMAYHTHWNDLRRSYSDLDGMVSDGFSTTEAAYLWAQSHLEQDPRPEQFMIGRLTTAVAMQFKLTVTNAVQGNVIAVDIIDASGNVTQVRRTIPGSSSTSAEATAVAALIAAISGVASAAAVGAVITVNITATGTIWYAENIAFMSYQDTTADANVDTDLTALEVVESGFYGAETQYHSKANLDKLAAWLQTRKLIGPGVSADTAEKSSGAIFPNWKTQSYSRCFPMFSSHPSEWPGAAWLGARLPYDPGEESVEWAWCELVGVTPENLTTTERNYLESQNVNYYEIEAGLPVVKLGTMPNGLFIDDVAGTDALGARMQERVFGVRASNKRLSYEDLGGIAKIGSAMRAVLKQFVRSGFLTAGDGKSITPPSVTPQTAAAADPADRKARVLRNMKFDGYKAGGINKVYISGNLST